jgi:hypothetical protein
MRTRLRIATLASVLALVLAGCTGDEPDDRPTEAPGTPPVVTPIESPELSVSPTPPALPDEPPATRGGVALDCVNGWVTPPRDSPRFTQPLGIIRRTTGVEGR